MHLGQSIAPPEVLVPLHIAISLKNFVVVVDAGVSFERRDVVRRARRAPRRGALQRMHAVPAWCELYAVVQRRQMHISPWQRA